MQPFTSPILESTRVNGQSYKQLQNALYAIQYNLEKILPKGGTACVLFPKNILENILPAAAKEKNCKIILIQGPKILASNLLKERLLEPNTNKEADVYITEPAGFTPGGALVEPNEVKQLQNLPVIGVGSALQWTMRAPAEYDYIVLSKIVTETGIHSPEDFENSRTLL